jgi:F-type H+-transporting ATPase subunit a
MDEIGSRLVWYYIPFTDIEIPMNGVNVLTLVNSLIVMGALFAFCRYAISKMSLTPGRAQFVVEQFIGMFDDLVSTSLELETRERNRKFLPLIFVLFVFLLVANCVGFLPMSFAQEPTADVNTTLGLGLLGMFVATWCGIRAKGALGYFMELLGPLFAQEDAKGFAAIMGKLSALFFFPLNIIGEIAKVVSISFRIFGNILGGSIIMIVISTLIYSFSPMLIGMNLFFVFFVGTVHAFVFTMLTLTYIAVAIK